MSKEIQIIDYLPEGYNRFDILMTLQPNEQKTIDQVEDELKVTDAQIMAYFGGTAIVKEVTPVEEENELEDVPQIEDTDWKEEDNNDTCNPF